MVSRATMWRPFATTDSVGGEITPINDPYLYSVIYASDGTLSYVADCNSGTRDIHHQRRHGG